MMLSFIVCTYNREKYIYECLKRLITNKTDTDWELIVVDNNSTDNTLSEIRRFERDYNPQNYRYVLETQQGLSYARNRGIREAKGDWLVFLDDDAFVESDYIQTLQHYIVTLPDMHAFGGKILPLFEDGRSPSWLCRWNMSWVSALDKGNRVSLMKGAEFPTGANMGIKAETARQCGLFNTTLGRTGKNLIGGEEKDYFNRIKALNGNIYYLPAIAVRHCIPLTRTTYNFIRRLGEGVGLSEQIRTLNEGKKSYLKRICAELVKWCATLLLSCYYAITLRPACGYSLLIFRYHVSKTLTLKNSNSDGC